MPDITEPPRDQASLHELARVGNTLALIKHLEDMPKYDSGRVMDVDAPDDRDDPHMTSAHCLSFI